MSLADPSFSGVSAGGELLSGALGPRVSEDGRWIAFRSRGGALLLPGYEGGGDQIFLADRLLGTVRLVSAAAGTTLRGANAPANVPVVSPNGRFVVFGSLATDLLAGLSGGNLYNAYLWDRDAPPESALRLISHTPFGALERGDRHSFPTTVSADGRWVTVLSSSTDLIAGGVVEGGVLDYQVYFWDRDAATASATRLVSHAWSSDEVAGDDNCYNAEASVDGRYVAYVSYASDLIPHGGGSSYGNVYLWDRDAPPLFGNRLVSHSPSSATFRGGGASRGASISDDGRFVAYTSSSWDLIVGQTGSGENIYLWDRDAAVPAATRLVSHTPAGATVAGGRSTNPRIGEDSRYVTYESWSDDLAGASGVVATNIYQWDAMAPAASANRLVSHSFAGATIRASGGSGDPAASADGRFVTYLSVASDIAGIGPGTPDTTDIYVWDRDAPGATANRLVSHTFASSSLRAKGMSEHPTLSGDGAVIAFESDASDLAEGDSYFEDVFAADTATLQVELLSAKPEDLPWPRMTADGDSGSYSYSGPTLSSDGRYGVFPSPANDLLPALSGPPGYHVYLWDAALRTIRLVSHTPESATERADSGAGSAEISPDGRYVMFESSATDLVSGSTGGATHNVYLWDREAPAHSATRLVSHTAASPVERGNGDVRWPNMSADGRFIAYSSEATDLVAGGAEGDGFQAFLWDRDAPVAVATRLVSHTPAGSTMRADKVSREPRISPDGRFVAHASAASDLVEPPHFTIVDQLYLWDRTAPAASATRLVSHTPASATVRGDSESGWPIVSANGRYVAYSSQAWDIVDAGTQNRDVFLWDRFAPTASANRLVTHRPSLPLRRGNGPAYPAAISADGRFVAYSSVATNLIAGGSGGEENNAYLWDRDAPFAEANRLISHTPEGATVRGNSDSGAAGLSSDARFVVLASTSTDLVTGETGDSMHTWWASLYRWDRLAPPDAAIALISHTQLDPLRRAAEQCRFSGMSASANEVAFSSGAPDIVPADLNDAGDAFWWSDRTIAGAIFVDGFGSGDTTAWSATEGAGAGWVSDGFRGARLEAESRPPRL